MVIQTLSLLYYSAVKLRNFLYDRNILKAKKVPVPVISVGNISSGGSGKTSLVRFLAENFSEKNKVCILLRGYKRRSRGTIVVSDGERIYVDVRTAGDEAFMLSRLLKGVIVIVSEKRYEGALKAVELGAELIILDDGFQHRKLFRDVDIVLLKRRDLSDKLLPAGLLREPLSSLNRADAVVLSYQDVEGFEFNFSKPVFKMFRSFKYLINSNFERVSIEKFKGKSVIAFCGLGNNVQFIKSLKNSGFKIKEFYSFPDHYEYKNFEPKEGEIYITTLKDLVKLPGYKNVYALDFEVRVDGLIPFLKEKLKI